MLLASYPAVRGTLARGFSSLQQSNYTASRLNIAAA